MQSEEIKKILSCVGKPVHFTFPPGEPAQRGVLKERTVFVSPYGGTVPYWDVVDLIEFEGQNEPEFIRIGYYRKPGKRLNWGSQTTITETVSGWKGLLVKAAREQKWFRKLLDDVMKELQTPPTQ